MYLFKTVSLVFQFRIPILPHDCLWQGFDEPEQVCRSSVGSAERLVLAGMDSLVS